MMATVDVALAERSYPIHIDKGLVQTSPLSSYIRSKRVCIITNITIAPLYLAQLQQQLTEFELDVCQLPDGEQYKNLASFEQIMAHLLSGNHGRDTTLIALGGGVIGDITGFAAACYQRGIDFIQMPTTLLSQVDSSVGGKTAVNHPLGKNMIGAFYQPKAVLIDINTLTTLPAREFSAGMAEVIKYGILGDTEFFDWLEQNAEHIVAKDDATLIAMIKHCCQQKADIVARDETENSVRALLNLGHTFGHAIEAEQGYGVWLHGEAVAAGMVIAAKVSEKMDLLQASDVRRIEALLQRFNLPITAPDTMCYQDFVKHMVRDKKNLNGAMRFVLPTRIGDSIVTDKVSEETLQQVL